MADLFQRLIETGVNAQSARTALAVWAAVLDSPDAFPYASQRVETPTVLGDGTAIGAEQTILPEFVYPHGSGSVDGALHAPPTGPHPAQQIARSAGPDRLLKPALIALGALLLIAIGTGAVYVFKKNSNPIADGDPAPGAASHEKSPQSQASNEPETTETTSRTDSTLEERLTVLLLTEYDLANLVADPVDLGISWEEELEWSRSWVDETDESCRAVLAVDAGEVWPADSDALTRRIYAQDLELNAYSVARSYEDAADAELALRRANPPDCTEFRATSNQLDPPVNWTIKLVSELETGGEAGTPTGEVNEWQALGVQYRLIPESGENYIFDRVCGAVEKYLVCHTIVSEEISPAPFERVGVQELIVDKFRDLSSLL